MKTLKDIAWAAGIIEGEGCLIAHTYKRPDGYVIRAFRLAVEMTDLDVLIRLRDILGQVCTLRERKPPSVNPKHARRYILCLTGTELAAWLMTIYPLMGERRKAKIRVGLSLWKTMRPNWRHSKQRQTLLRIA